MAALLSAVQLVLEVDSRSTILGEQLGELNDSGQTTMSGKSISQKLPVNRFGTHPVSPSATMGRK